MWVHSKTTCVGRGYPTAVQRQPRKRTLSLLNSSLHWTYYRLAFHRAFPSTDEDHQPRMSVIYLALQCGRVWLLSLHSYLVRSSLRGLPSPRPGVCWAIVSLGICLRIKLVWLVGGSEGLFWLTESGVAPIGRIKRSRLLKPCIESIGTYLIK